MSKSARWVFTVNNAGEYRPRWDVTAMEYLVWQMERGDSGTPHVQGYVRFKNAKTLAGAKNAIVCSEAHMEVANGNEQQCRDYCTKAETRIGEPVEHGKFEPAKGKKGKRTDIDAMVVTIKGGATERMVAEQHPAEYMKFHAGIAKMCAFKAEEQAQAPRDIHTTVLWGPTGTGKTHRARAGRGVADIYVAAPGRGPFDQYNRQRILVFEEFDYNKWDVEIMKECLDKWPMQLDARFTNKFAMWDHVIILSNRSPDEWYNMDNRKPAFMRRLMEPMGRIYEVTSVDQVVDMEWWVPKPVPLAIAPAVTPRIVTGDAQDHGGAGASTAPVLARTDSVNLQTWDSYDPDDESQKN